MVKYHPGSYHRKGGYTDVVDPYGNSTRYAYNSKFLLTGVDHREKGKGVFAKERFEWSEYDSKKGHWLKEKILKDAQGVALRRIRYHYDHKGNVEKEELVGDLTGAGNNLECYVVKRRYNRANLVTEERFPNGKVIEYLYVPDTNLIHAKLIRDQEKIKIRHGFTYNGTVLKRKIIDDGATRDLQNLTGVTQRIIMDIHPKYGGLFLDFPEVIEEKYLDLSSGKECLLGRQKLEYHSNGKPTSVVYFDAEGKERYIVHRFYDKRGRLIREIDPLGREKRYRYDANDNLIGDHHPDREYEVC